VPDKEKEEKEVIVPRWDIMETISTDIEKIFFEQSAKKQLSPYEMSIIVNRLGLLFDEYKLVHFMSKFGEASVAQDKTIGISGSNSIYR